MAPIRTSCMRSVLQRKAPQLTYSARFLSLSRSRASISTPETHYEFFPETLSAGPPPAGPFVIDTTRLRREFLQKQASAHPDKYPQDMKRRAEATSARINEAYKTLSDPLTRTQYILSLKGVDVADDETARVEDPELLMQVLETREVIEEAEEESDLDPLKQKNDVNMARSLEILDKAFANDDMEIAKQEAIKLRYWVNIRDSLANWEKGKPVVMVH
ncbi:MAG: hypothetical protein M1828_006349 [Chrysothrix sp. TS-e1954]|nr:MAG: hypothetical protein M1828_006349 [Chrysothrix sp. TS-e1954]